MLRVGVIGYGYWGPNLVRNFMETEGARVEMVADGRRDRLERATARYPAVRAVEDALELIADPAVDAVCIATPISTHHDLARRALDAGKHVLVEKPLAASHEEARDLVDRARKAGRVLMVDHTFVYTGAVRKIRELVTQGVLGELYYYDAVRVNLGLFQGDVSVLWDLAVHDLSILDHVVGQGAEAVSATSVAHVEGQPANLAYVTVFFPGNLVAHVNVNWLAPAKIRRTLIGGSEKMIIYDDLEPSEKVRVYDRGISLIADESRRHELLVSYRSGDMWAPRIDLTEALSVLGRHFVACVEGRETPITDGESGSRVVRILEAAEASVRLRGGAVEL